MQVDEMVKTLHKASEILDGFNNPELTEKTMTLIKKVLGKVERCEIDTYPKDLFALYPLTYNQTYTFYRDRVYFQTKFINGIAVDVVVGFYSVENSTFFEESIRDVEDIDLVEGEFKMLHK